MHLLDSETVESMLRDVRLYEAIYGTDPDGARSDLCCHIKALVAERADLLKHRDAMSLRLQRLHDATIVLRGAIATMPETIRDRCKNAVEQANNLIVKAGTE